MSVSDFLQSSFSEILRNSDGGFSQVERVKKLLEQIPHVDSPDKDGNTLLISACKGLHVEVISYLTECGADVNAKKRNGQSPLHVLAGNPNTPLEIFDIINSPKLDVNLRDARGNSCLMVAIKQTENKELISKLLMLGVDVNIQNYAEMTVLHLAVERDTSEEILELLINAGVDLNIEYEMFTDALLQACKLGRSRIVRYLLQKGCNPNGAITKKKPRNPLAVISVDIHLYHFYHTSNKPPLRADVDSTFPLFVACDNFDIDTAKILIQHGAEVNCVDYEESSAFTRVLKNSDKENWELSEKLLQMLIDFGADLSYTPHGRGTYLMIACRDANVEAVEFLLKKGVDPNQVDSKGNTALHVCGDIGILEMLLEYEANLEHVNNMGITCFMKACYSKSNTLVNHLLKKNPNLDIKDNSGRTALHFLASSVEVRGRWSSDLKESWDTIVTDMLNRNPKMEKSSVGLTPVMEAAMCRNLHLTEIFLSYKYISKIDKVEALEVLSLHLNLSNERKVALQKLIEIGHIDKELQLAPDHEGFELNQAEQVANSGDFFHHKYSAYQRIFGANHVCTKKVVSDCLNCYTRDVDASSYDYFLAEFCHFIKHPLEEDNVYCVHQYSRVVESVASHGKNLSITDMMSLYELMVTCPISPDAYMGCSSIASCMLATIKVCTQILKNDNVSATDGKLVSLTKKFMIANLSSSYGEPVFFHVLRTTLSFDEDPNLWIFHKKIFLHYILAGADLNKRYFNCKSTALHIIIYTFFDWCLDGSVSDDMLHDDDFQPVVDYLKDFIDYFISNGAHFDVVDKEKLPFYELPGFPYEFDVTRTSNAFVAGSSRRTMWTTRYYPPT